VQWVCNFNLILKVRYPAAIGFAYLWWMVIVTNSTVPTFWIIRAPYCALVVTSTYVGSGWPTHNTIKVLTPKYWIKEEWAYHETKHTYMNKSNRGSWKNACIVPNKLRTWTYKSWCLNMYMYMHSNLCHYNVVPQLHLIKSTRSQVCGRTFQ